MFQPLNTQSCISPNSTNTLVLSSSSKLIICALFPLSSILDYINSFHFIFVGIRTTSESTESEGSSDEDEHTVKDNVIRATWSRVAALHCVMLPERMAGYFRAPHLPVLASRFMDQSQAVSQVHTSYTYYL